MLVFLARKAHSGQIALDIGYEYRNAHFGEGFCDHL